MAIKRVVISFGISSMDKGYDSENLYRQIREDMGADSVIPVKTWKGKIYSGNTEMRCITTSILNAIARGTKLKRRFQSSQEDSEMISRHENIGTKSRRSRSK